MTFEYHAPIDFFILLGLIANETEVTQVKGLLSSNGAEMVAECKSKISSFLIRDIEEFFRSITPEPIVYSDYLNYVWNVYPEARTISDVIERVERSDPRALMVILATTVLDGDMDKLSKILWNAHEKDPFAKAQSYVSRQWTTASKDRLMEYLRHANEIQRRFIFLLRGFYDEVYRSLADTLENSGHRLIDRVAHTYASDPSTVLATMKLANPHVGGDFIVHASPLIGEWTHVVLRDTQSPGQLNWVILGSDVETASDSEDVEGFVRLFGDKTRMEILKRLRQKPCYGAELAHALQLSPAAISYHMLFFFQMDLVTIEKKGRRYYYSLNLDRLELLWERGKSILVGQRP